MASVDSGVETSSESIDSSIVQEPKTLEINPINIPQGVNVLISKACTLENSNTEEKSYSFISPEFPKIETPVTLRVCKLQPGSESSRFDDPMQKISYSYERETFNAVMRRGRRGERGFSKPYLSRYVDIEETIEKRVEKTGPCPFFKLRCLVSERRLRLAASTNNEELVAFLLEIGVNPNGHDCQRRTALHLASCRGYANIVRMLLEKGANPNLKDALDNTPLHLAACTNHVEVVTLLLKAGTDINSSDSYGRSPLQLAQSKLKLLHQSCSNNEDSMRVKQEVRKVIEMILTFLQKKGQETEAGSLNEVLNSFHSRFTISQTKEEVETDVKDLLDSLNNLNLN